jgi:signal transduction histidine kinase
VNFREPLLWDRYRGVVIAAIVAFLGQSALIAGLLLQRSMRRKAEAQVRESELDLRRSYDRIRDLGLRLLNAQENERARIARELHDDVSQQMSLLGIDLEQLNGAVEGEAVQLTNEALDRSRQIAKSIHDLSHRLHPARLQLLGLVGALRGLQREMSQPGVAVTFSSDRVPPLTQELTLSLFRIAQEAVQNSIKHGKAQQVTITLTGVDNGLKLSISDDGAGFDIDKGWGLGLGLISIQERIEAVRGKVSIRSAPGKGTTLDVSVPVYDQPASGRIAV